MTLVRSRLIPLVLGLLVLTAAAEEEMRPAVKMSPQIREVERDRAYFDNIDCRRLDRVEARTEGEARHLKRRKQACLETYRAFIPHH